MLPRSGCQTISDVSFFFFYASHLVWTRAETAPFSVFCERPKRNKKMNNLLTGKQENIMPGGSFLFFFNTACHTYGMTLLFRPPYYCADDPSGRHGNYSVRGRSSRKLCTAGGPFRRGGSSPSQTSVAWRGSRLHVTRDRREGRIGVCG